jgi:hypothetical protein
MDERPAIEQVKSGFRIVGAILTSFAAFVLFTIGYIDIVTPEKQRAALGWVILLTTVTAMSLTVRFWATWFCGIVAYFAVRSTALVFFALRGRLVWWIAIGLSVSLWIMAVLSVRFYHRHEFPYFEQLSITVAAVCLFWSFARLSVTGDSGMLLPVVIGLPLLFFSAYQKPLKRLLRRFSY